MNTFTVREAVRFGWETFKKRPWFFIGCFLFISILSNFSLQNSDGGWNDIGADAVGVLMALATVILFVVNTVAKMGSKAFLLKAHDAPESVQFMDLWAPHPFWRFVVATLIKGLVIGVPAVGLAALAFFTSGVSVVFFASVILAVGWIVVMGVKYMFVELIVMDTNAKPMEALKESARMTKGHFGALFVFLLAMGGIMLLGLLALVVGILVAIPVTMFAFAHVYKALRAGDSARAIS